MGVVYKLKPQIKAYILKNKNKEPSLSCRKLAALVLEKFQIKLSKSRINTIIKTAGLSLPVGRRRKRRRRAMESAGLGMIFLKAADYLVGGSAAIVEAIKNRMKSPLPDILAKTEALLYSPLGLKPDSGLATLTGKAFTQADLLAYLTELQGVTALSADIFRIVSTIFQEVRVVKVGFSTGSSFYLDSQLHTVWSTPNIPYDFSTTIYNLKSYIKKYLQEESPFVLFMAPGYDTPIKEFFDFILGFAGTEKKIASFTLYGHKFEELEVIKPEAGEKRFFLFGLWPWQFGNYRRVKSMGEFKPFAFTLLNENFYLAEVEIELVQPTVNKSVILRGCALKRSLEEKIRLLILSNTLAEKFNTEQLAQLYLSHWPNLEEGFKDFSRKIELFTYTAGSQRFFSTENLPLEGLKPEEIKGLFQYYLEALDLYVRWHFLPSGYEDKESALVKERFYTLNGRLKQQKEQSTFTFKLPADYRFGKDLEYALRRLNEREIFLGENRRCWFALNF